MASRRSGVNLEAAVRHYAGHEAAKELERLEELGACEAMVYVIGGHETEETRLCDQYTGVLEKLEKQLIERLTNGELIGSGYFSNQAVERTDVPADLWLFLEVDSDNSKAKGEGFTISAIMVRQDPATERVVSSAKAGKDCRAWLQAEVKRLGSPPRKDDMFQKAKELFGDQLSRREFDRAWRDVTPPDWQKKGRRKKTEQ